VKRKSRPEIPNIIQPKGNIIMLKLNASYSKKVPAEQDYSSKSYHASIECEMPSGQTAAQLKKKISDTFKLVEAAVEAEIATEPTLRMVKPQAAPQPTKPATQKETGTLAATNKQIQYLIKLAEEAGQGLKELNDAAQTQFKAESIYQLTRRDASALVDQLKLAA
jgi:hypothetical protein